MVLEKSPSIILKASDCPVETVTVFSSTAEVTRLVHVKVQEGTQDIIIKGFSGRVDTSSLRVTAGGKEKLSIVEVNYAQRPVPLAAELSVELEEKNNQLKEFESLEDKLRTRNIEIEESRKFIESYASRLTNEPTTTGDVADLFTESSIKGIHQFMKIYRQKLEAYDFDQSELNKGLRDLRQQKMVLIEELRELRKVAAEITHEVTITLFANEASSLILRLLYVVDSCTWSPSYDVRASAHDSRAVSLTYYAVVQQNTGEDWEKAKMTFSTAKPSITGTLPTPTPQTIQLRSNSPARPPQKKKIQADVRSRRKTVDLASFNFDDLVNANMGATGSGTMINSNSAGSSAERGSNISNSSNSSSGSGIIGSNSSGSNNNNNTLNANLYALSMLDQDQSAAPSSVHDNTAKSATVVFTVQSASTIKSDDKPHKVTILVTELDTRFTHTCVPRLEQRTYLKAYITNITDHHFLAGPASIFYDNSFISTAQIQDISPQENFEVRMGTDSTVKVEYKAIQKHKEIGSSTSKIQSQTFSHKIIVTNTRPAEADVVVLEQYPKSNDERIKIRLVEPSQEEGPNHAVNDAHNIEWRVTVKSNHATEIPYSFSIDWPLDREIDISSIA